MAKVSLVTGTTSYLARVFIQDSSSTTGAGLTGLAFNTASLVCYRARDDDGNAGGTAITLATATRGTWTSGGFVEKDATNMPGVYEFGIPNAALASGSKTCTIMFKGATNMAPLALEIELTAVNNQDSVRGGMTALANAAAGASGGLLISGSNSGTTTLGALTVTGATTLTGNVALADGLTIAAPSTSNRAGLDVAGNGTGAALKLTAGATGNGLLAAGGATSGSAVKFTGTAGNAIALELAGQGSAAGLSTTGGASGQGLKVVGGSTSGDGIAVTTTSGNAMSLAATGTSMHGLVVTGGNGGTSDGFKANAGTGGVPIRGNITGNITGTLDTVTNLTNAATSGDLTATMKTSVATAATGTAVTESYATDGSAATLGQLAYMIWAFLAEKSVSSTTLTAKKLDGSTTAMTFTLSDATNPVSITRAS